MNADLSIEQIRRDIAETFHRNNCFITLYDQFGRPVWVPGKKIGDAIAMRRPTKLIEDPK